MDRVTGISQSQGWAAQGVNAVLCVFLLIISGFEEKIHVSNKMAISHDAVTAVDVGWTFSYRHLQKHSPVDLINQACWAKGHYWQWQWMSYRAKEPVLIENNAGGWPYCLIQTASWNGSNTLCTLLERTGSSKDKTYHQVKLLLTEFIPIYSD